MKIRAMIVDDEPPLRDEMAYLLQAHPEVEVVAQFDRTGPALEYLSGNPCELVFLDIRMPGMDGMEFARCIGEMKLKTQVIFVTAYGEYALDAFDTPATGYLTKPVSRVALARALEKAKALMTQAPRRKKPGGRIGVTRDGKLHPIRRSEIVMAYVREKTVFVRTKSGDFLSRRSFQETADFLSGEPFLQVHRRYIVNLDYVAEVVPWFKGSYILRMKGFSDEDIPVSRNHLPEVKRLLGLQ